MLFPFVSFSNLNWPTRTLVAYTELNGGPKADPWDGLWKFTERARSARGDTPRSVVIARQDKGSELGRRGTDGNLKDATQTPTYIYTHTGFIYIYLCIRMHIRYAHVCRQRYSCIST